MKDNSEEADRIDITYYTDPLCCWSWALEPVWRKLQLQYGASIAWQYKMGGLIPDWKTYHDVEHSVSKPIQMGPVWMHAATLSRMPVNSTIWVKNPPASSYPACIAFKCVELQSRDAAEIYLRFLREAVMIQGENIADKTVLIQVAEKVTAIMPSIDINAFKTNLVNDIGIEAFRKDLIETQTKRVERFPTLIFRRNKEAIIMKGYQPYAFITKVLEKLKPGIEASEITRQTWLVPTARELEELELVK